MFGQPVARYKAARAEARAVESSGKLLENAGTDRFGATPGDTPAREIERVYLRWLHSAQAELVGEVGSKRYRRAVSGDGLQPGGRPLQEQHGRHDDDVGAEMNGGQKHPDQSHVVI